MDGFDPPATTFVKGVGLNSAMEFAELELGRQEVRDRLRELESEYGDYEVYRLTGAMVPLRAAAAAWMAVAELHGGTVAERRRFFQRMGVHIADTNLNGVYKTLLSLVANPERLVKRIPVLWNTYFKGLEIDVDLSEVGSGRVLHETTGFGGAPHIGEMAEGWIAFAFELVGGKDVRVFERSLEQGAPNPEPTMRFDIEWRVGSR